MKVIRDHDALYLQEDRKQQTKESFKFIVSKASAHLDQYHQPRIADIGCATGDFLYYLKSLYPESELTGIDVMGELLERAAAEVKKIMKEQELEQDAVLRLGVSGGGCSGFSYRIAFDKAFDKEADSKYPCHGVDVVVDKKSSLYLDGTTVDFYDGLEKRGFTFDNPNAVKSCGCGSSFQA